MHTPSDPDKEPSKRKPAYSTRYSSETLEDIKLYLPEYLEALEVFLFESGSSLKGQCPIHDDNNPSFSVYGENRHRWKCFACDKGGDIFALSIALGRAKTFPGAVREVAKTVGYALPKLRFSGAFRDESTVDQVRKLREPKDPKANYDLSEAEEAFRLLARIDLRKAIRKSAKEVEAIADHLGIPLPVLLQAARGDSGLGLVDGKLAYVYPKGVKTRMPPGSDPRFIWNCGRAYAPWRFDRVTADTTTIYLTEGETDALAIIACGIEADRTTVVVASPGVSFPESWGALFGGKDVVLFFDFDLPGQTAVRKVARILSEHAKSVRIVRPND